MNFIIIIAFITLILAVLGYSVSTLNVFKTNRTFRLSIYFLIIIINLEISKSVFSFFNLRGYSGILGGELYGTTGGAFSIWYYFGSILNKTKKNKYQKFKFLLGNIQYVVGIITLIFWIYNLTIKNSINKFDFLHFYIGITQLIFGYSFIKSSKNDYELPQNYWR